MNLEDMLRKTDALTYTNALKATVSEIKDELSVIEELSGHINQSVVKLRKLTRRADAQYRVIAKLAQNQAGGLANNVSIDDDDIEDEIDKEAKELMEEA